MDRYSSGRRAFLKKLSALGVAGFPLSMPQLGTASSAREHDPEL